MRSLFRRRMSASPGECTCCGAGSPRLTERVTFRKRIHAARSQPTTEALTRRSSARRSTAAASWVVEATDENGGLSSRWRRQAMMDVGWPSQEHHGVQTSVAG